MEPGLQRLRSLVTGVYTTDSYYTVYTNSFTDTTLQQPVLMLYRQQSITGYGNDVSNTPC